MPLPPDSVTSPPLLARVVPFRLIIPAPLASRSLLSVIAWPCVVMLAPLLPKIESPACSKTPPPLPVPVELSAAFRVMWRAALSVSWLPLAQVTGLATVMSPLCEPPLPVLTVTLAVAKAFCSVVVLMTVLSAAALKLPPVSAAVLIVTS